MKLRGIRRNKIHQPDALRNLSKENLENTLNLNNSLSGMLKSLNMPTNKYYRDLLLAQLDKYQLDYSKIKLKKSRLIDLSGRIFGRLQVICRTETTKSGHTMWLCEEIGTGIRKPVASTHLLRDNTKSFTLRPVGHTHAQWQGFGEISGNYWCNVKRKAEERKLEFSITIEEAWNLFLKQDRKCALSDDSIYFPETGKCPYTASLDRIDSSKGYILDNIQWVHSKINIMKNKFVQSEFIDFCKKVANKYK